jgi:FMN phosphatase YigB (HAD superfamily)
VYNTRECWQIAEGADDLPKNFNSLGIPLGIVSNYDGRLETVLKAMELHHYFRFIITSYCAGFVKPYSRIFDLALGQLDNGRIKSHEAVRVGDSPEIDYLGAVKAGWNAILVHQNAKVTEQALINLSITTVYPVCSDQLQLRWRDGRRASL